MPFTPAVLSLHTHYSPQVVGNAPLRSAAEWRGGRGRGGSEACHSTLQQPCSQQPTHTTHPSPQPPRAVARLRPSGLPGVHLPTAGLIYAGTKLACRARYRLSATLSSCPDFCPVVRPVSPSRSVRIFIFRPAVQSFTGSLTAPHPPLSRMERGRG